MDIDQTDEPKTPETEPVPQPQPQPQEEEKKNEAIAMSSEENKEEKDTAMEEDLVKPATVFCIRLNQPRSSLLHKMSVPNLCRNFSAVSWCGKLNAIACASETCVRIPSSTQTPPFWIPIHIVIPERPTECSVFNVTADSPRDSVQFIEWSPTSCSRALLVANFLGRVTIWTQPSQGPANCVMDASCWQLEHEWQQDIATVTKWLSGVSRYRWFSSKSTAASSKSAFEEKFLSPQPQISAGWPNFLCVCSVLSSGSVQLRWSQWLPSQKATPLKWFCTSKALLGCGPSGIMAADAIITDSGALHVAGVPIVNPSTVVVWEVMPGPGYSFQATPKTSIDNIIPPSSPPNWTGFSPLAAYLFSWQDYLLSEDRKGKKPADQNLSDNSLALQCMPVSNFSAYVSPKVATQSAPTTTRGSGVTAVAFDPSCGGSVITVVIVEGQYMSPHDPDEGPSVTGWRVQRWESSLQPVFLHRIFGNGGQIPMQTVWKSKVDLSIPPTHDFKNQQAPAVGMKDDVWKASGSGFDGTNRVNFDPYDLPRDVRTLARVVYSAHGGEVAIAFLHGGVHIFSGPDFAPVQNYQINVGSAIAAPAFSSTSCCSASVWHDTGKDQSILKIIRVLPPAIPTSQVKASSSTWEREIADRFWWSLLVGVDWWDAVGCTQSAAEDGIVSFDSVIAVLDADFHSLPSGQHRQQYCRSLDRIKCRLLEGSNSPEVRALVMDMQARLLLDMLGNGIESAMIDPSALVSDPWLASSSTLSSIDPGALAVELALVPNIQAYVDSVLDLASHFITRLRHYSSFCRALANNAATAGTGSNQNTVASPAQSSATPPTSQGGQTMMTRSSGSPQMQAPTPNPPISGPSPFIPSINTGTFIAIPAVRLVGDCHFLHRLCQLLLFCFFFWRTQLPRYMGGVHRAANTNTPQPQLNASAPGKVDESRQTAPGRSRFGSGNGGQGYSFDEVKVLFLVLMDLCRRTCGLQHPLPVSQVGSSFIHVRLHYIDGNYTIMPEVLEAFLSPHMQNMPRPKAADAAGLLLRQLELQSPSEEWHRRITFGGPWSDPDDADSTSDAPKPVSSNTLDGSLLDNCDVYYGAHGLFPNMRRMSERDAAFGLNHSVGLGPYLGLMGSRRDVITTLWKTGVDGIWFKCIRCLRQTCAFSSPGSTDLPRQNEEQMWWINRWAYGCPMCGGAWVRVV